jgi:hypothetical protein
MALRTSTRALMASSTAMVSSATIRASVSITSVDMLPLASTRL